MPVNYPVSVMVARSVPDLPIGDRYAYEPKFDGFRCVAFRTDKPYALLHSRAQRSFTDRFRDVGQAVADQVPEGTVLDGELVVVADGKLDFSALLDRLASPKVTTPACLIAFDVLADQGEDVRGLPYLERRARLEKLVGAGNAGLNIVPMTLELRGANAWLNQHRKAGIEGVVAKDVGEKYLPGNHRWWKVRSWSSTEAIVGGVTGPLDEPSGLILGRRDAAGRLRVVGRSFPLPRSVRMVVGDLLTPAGLEHPWPAALKPGRFGDAQPIEYTQVEPKLVVELEVDVAHDRHQWRHGVRFIRPRLDLKPEDVPLLSRSKDSLLQRETV